MMMIVLVSIQHKVTTKYKMQATPHFSLICQSGEDIIIQTGQVGFAAGQVGFAAGQVDFAAGQVDFHTPFDSTHLFYINMSENN